MITPTGGAISGYTFNSSTYTYASVTALNPVASVTITPTGTGTIKVNNVTVVSGSASAAINLADGINTITVTKQDTGKTLKTYTITITKAVAPNITGAAYDGGTGQLTLTGTNLNTGIDVNALKLTLTGLANGQKTLTVLTSDAKPTSATQVTITIAGADKTAVDLLLNTAGTSASDLTDYNLALDSDWHKTAGGSAIPILGITVSNPV